MSEDVDTGDQHGAEQPDRSAGPQQPGESRQPSGRPPEGERSSPRRHPPDETAHESPTDTAGETAENRVMESIVGVFLAVAVGYGVGLFLFEGFADESVGQFALIALLVPIFGAPMLSVVTGAMTGLRLETDDQSGALASAVGAFVGFLVMLLLLVAFASVLVSDGEVGDRLNGLFLELAAFGFGVAVTGAATTFLVTRLDV